MRWAAVWSRTTGPSVNQIVAGLAANQYRFSSLVLGIVNSVPFQERRALDQRRSTLMFVTRKHLERRTFLRGMGAAIALPMLDAMVPAFAAPGNAAQAAPPDVFRLRAQRHRHGQLDA